MKEELVLNLFNVGDKVSLGENKCIIYEVKENGMYVVLVGVFNYLEARRCYLCHESQLKKTL